MRIANLTESEAIVLSAEHAITRAGPISEMDESRIFSQAKQRHASGMSPASVIGYVHSEVTRCAKCERGAA